MMPSPRSCDTATEHISDMAQLGFPWLVLAWLKRDITLNAMAWQGSHGIQSACNGHLRFKVALAVL